MKFECWHDYFDEDDWKSVEAYDFHDAAESFFRSEAEEDFELTDIDELFVRCDGVVKRFRCYTEPSVEYYASEIDDS